MQESGRHEPVREVVGEAPGPREPAAQLALGRDDGGADSGDEEVVEPGAAAGRLREALVPAHDLVPELVTADEHAAALERGAQRPELLGLRPSSIRRSSVDDGPASARWSSSRAQSRSSACMRSSSARTIGSSSAATASETSRCLPRCTFTAVRPGRCASSANHCHFVRGHSPNPPAPGL